MRPAIFNEGRIFAVAFGGESLTFSQMPAEKNSDLFLYRSLLAIAGSVYLIWWVAVELMPEHYFNPLPSRLAAVAYFFLWLILSFFSPKVRKQLPTLYASAIWILTAHFFYLFQANAGGNNWVIGSFITILATSYCFFHPRSLLIYSVFVAAISGLMIILLPALQHSVFLPGILTILLQANISLLARERVIRRLQESNGRFQLLFHSTWEGVLVHENQKVVTANESIARMLGYDRNALTGKKILDLVHPSVRALTAEKIQAADSTPTETQGLRPDGSAIEIEVRAKDIFYEGKPLRLLTVRDLSDRRRMESERIRAQAMQEKAKALDDFISLASHELKTPLTSVKLWVQMLAKDLEKMADNARGVETIQLISKQISRLANLVEMMLDASQIAAAKLRIENQEVNLVALARETTQNLLPQSKRIGSPILLHAPEALFLKGDPTRLIQVMENLLTNALKYGNQHPIHLRITRTPNEAILEVEDSGIGMHAEDTTRIFDRFERLGSVKNITGLGLGLFLTQQIVRAHGGNISVTSQPAQGSIFTVRLPLSA